MSMSREFFDWVDSSPHRCFKRCFHEDLAHEFDPDSKVWDEQLGSDPYYSNYTCINFSDGTYVMFNYKGEVEESYDVPTTPRSSSSVVSSSVHNGS